MLLSADEWSTANRSQNGKKEGKHREELQFEEEAASCKLKKGVVVSPGIVLLDGGVFGLIKPLPKSILLRLNRECFFSVLANQKRGAIFTILAAR